MMGREVRMVPKDWQHPRDKRGQFIPLYGEDFQETAKEWLKGCFAWEEGTHKDLARDPTLRERYRFFWEWHGNPPDKDSYPPSYSGPCTHFQMYETCSEGTPISPVCETQEDLAHWLADNKASAFGGMTATYEQWLATIKAGWAPSAVFDSVRGMRPGVVLAEEKAEPAPAEGAAP